MMAKRLISDFARVCRAGLVCLFCKARSLTEHKNLSWIVIVKIIIDYWSKDILILHPISINIKTISEEPIPSDDWNFSQ